ncbi:sigma-70 family RNA polymerase sigma factor [Streptomyces sp. A1547]|uniref:RNA polymerase sigma factor n=1 Tax=Streptomyces sp. A1547 TaxID=2563105 RepID=UPI00144A63E5|nr:sigma-70 family RNA polymerase sigma factor [Streptomyces sp. A1547]
MNELEYEAFFRKDYPALVRHLAILGCRDEAAKDVAQEAMVRLLEQDGNVAHPRAWVRLTASRIAFDNNRRDIRRSQLSWQEANLPAAAPLGPAEQSAHQSEARQVLELLQGLPPRQREVMAWHFDGFSAGEIATLLGVKPATVQSNLRHARERLRQAWKQRTHGGGGKTI